MSLLVSFNCVGLILSASTSSHSQSVKLLAQIFIYPRSWANTKHTSSAEAWRWRVFSEKLFRELARMTPSEALPPPFPPSGCHRVETSGGTTRTRRDDPAEGSEHQNRHGPLTSVSEEEQSMLGRKPDAAQDGRSILFSLMIAVSQASQQSPSVKRIAPMIRLPPTSEMCVWPSKKTSGSGVVRAGSELQIFLIKSFSRKELLCRTFFHLYWVYKLMTAQIYIYIYWTMSHSL